MAKKSYVFISYSRRDAEFVKRLTGDLGAQGIQVWVDVENILPGENWQKEIAGAVKEARAFIYVASRDSLKSAFMASELAAFWTGGGNVIPVVIEDIRSSDLPPQIADIQWADFRTSYEEGLAALFEALGVKPSEAAPVEAKPRKSKGYAFLSYAEEDADFSRELKEFLKGRGYAYWDYEESDRDYQSQLFLELEGVIIEAVATLSILSESWKRSEWTVKEFFFSGEVGTPVFLLKAKEMSPTLAIAGLKYIDFTQSREKGFTKLEKELKRKRL